MNPQAFVLSDDERRMLVEALTFADEQGMYAGFARLRMQPVCDALLWRLTHDQADVILDADAVAGQVCPGCGTTVQVSVCHGRVIR